MEGGESARKLRSRFATTSLILALVLMNCFGILPRSFAASWGVRVNASYPRYTKSSVDSQVKTLSAQLNLTAEQRIKVKSILEVRQARLMQIRRDTSMSAVDRFNLIRAVHDSSNKQIRSILTEEQAKKFDQTTHRPQPNSTAPLQTGSSH